MKSQIVIGEVFNALIAILILLGVFATLFSIDVKFDKYTTQKKMELIFYNLDYQSKELCYESKMYNSTISRWVNLPSEINFHKYQIIGNGSHVVINCDGITMIERSNIVGKSYGGNTKIKCKNDLLTIS